MQSAILKQRCTMHDVAVFFFSSARQTVKDEQNIDEPIHSTLHNCDCFIGILAKEWWCYKSVYLKSDFGFKLHMQQWQQRQAERLKGKTVSSHLFRYDYYYYYYTFLFTFTGYFCLWLFHTSQLSFFYHLQCRCIARNVFHASFLSIYIFIIKRETLKRKERKNKKAYRPLWHMPFNWAVYCLWSQTYLCSLGNTKPL